MKKTKFVGVNGDEIFLMEGKNNTVDLYELLKSKGYIPDIEKEYGKEA